MAEKVVIGNAELWHGDCREVLPLLPQCDMVLTDPPYGVLDVEWDAMNPRELARFTMFWASHAAAQADCHRSASWRTPRRSESSARRVRSSS